MSEATPQQTPPLEGGDTLLTAAPGTQTQAAPNLPSGQAEQSGPQSGPQSSLAEQPGQASGQASGQPSGQPEQDPKNRETTEASVPERYDLKIPEGLELDKDMLERATPVFKELKLSGEQAQKLTDLYATRMTEARKNQLEAWNATLEGWRAAAERDPEIGGAAFARNIGLARSALDRFGTPGLKQVMDHYGMGNHPELIRLLCRVGAALREDSLVPGEGGAVTDPGRILYPNMA